MAGVTRRGFLGAATATVVAGSTGVQVALADAPIDMPADSTTGAVNFAAPLAPTAVVTSTDRRYLDLTNRGYNTRFVAQPESVRVVHSTSQVIAVVTEAVQNNKRLVVRSGGHCLDGLVDDPAVQIIIDISEMTDVVFDPTRQAFMVEAGSMLGHVYRTLYLDWGVTVPGGTCPTVGVGGHVTGGGYGALSRQYGSIVDHLYAVEVVVVDATGTVRSVVATSDAGDPNRDLWWAHTGGGGGNFGVVTRYWFRTPGATGDPGSLLPKPPVTLVKGVVSWPWSGMNATDFATIVRNHGAWHAANSADGSPYAGLHSVLILANVAVGGITLSAQIDGTLPNASQLMTAYLSAVTAGVSAPSTTSQSTVPWMKATLTDIYATGAFSRSKSKGAYLRQGWTDAQSASLYHFLSDATYDGHAEVLLYSYGGHANTVDPAATAMPQRDSILKANFINYWADPTQDTRHVGWMRTLYQQVYSTTGGVPVTNAANDGSYINYPDVDLTDPNWNTSGVPWQTLYWKDNYPRLQQIKAAYDPTNFFHHALSITAPGS
ncbi:FAD-binding oxidoreductase [Kitasatospora sp. LaBMicrA B282]|uniref:FAD-binding oxidoreductase n=1 Tax=Kitasatospora sp. LaBMicrA B282 TaxID=3420949 RepID=UPI003D119CB2